ncbi:MAG: guanosine-3,5-bis(diphosphate) 3-pyrophosphohydrolase [Bacteroidetes bacterium]|jgi:(p)ppGpp synthase/HD superfamily hydrolase|nr:guanosine-3,5-bis(diphosphate) 3-pyrophosphohydrolase [Bacteroidota bacterium]
MKQPWSIDELQDIWHLASHLHNGQKYGGANKDEEIEYLNHIGGVVFEILAAADHFEGMDMNFALKCAILHDALEDTDCSYERVKELFGREVADGVQALTKDEKLEGKRAKMTDSLERIKAQPREVWAVKLADRVVNLYAPPWYWSNDKKREYMEEAWLIHTELKDANAYLAQRLEAKIERYNRFLEKKSS